MSDFEAPTFNFDQYDRDEAIETKIRQFNLSIELDEAIAALDDANRRCSKAFEELEVYFDAIEARRKQ